jgi:hypothetical protein
MRQKPNPSSTFAGQLSPAADFPVTLLGQPFAQADIRHHLFDSEILLCVDEIGPEAISVPQVRWVSHGGPCLRPIASLFGSFAAPANER